MIQPKKRPDTPLAATPEAVRLSGQEDSLSAMKLFKEKIAKDNANKAMDDAKKSLNKRAIDDLKSPNKFL